MPLVTVQRDAWVGPSWYAFPGVPTRVSAEMLEIHPPPPGAVIEPDDEEVSRDAAPEILLRHHDYLRSAAELEEEIRRKAETNAPQPLRRRASNVIPASKV